MRIDKKIWLLAGILALLGVILHLMYSDFFSASTYAMNYFAAGQFAVGVFAIGNFAVGIFSIGIFSIGIFSLGIFSIGLWSIGIFIIARRKPPKKFINHIFGR